MPNILILYVALTLILVYLYLSVIASIVQELIAQLLSLRAQSLRRGVKTILDDPNFTGAAKMLYDHSLIRGLNLHSMHKGKGPSYIPPTLFADALMDLVCPAQSGAAAPMNFTAMRNAIADIKPDSPLLRVKPALLALADHSQQDLGKLRDAVAHWFDSSMDRLSGAYKRLSQLIILVLGVILAVAFNADTFAIARGVQAGPFAAEWPELSKQISALVANPLRNPNGQIDEATLNNTLSALTAAAPLGSSGLPLGWPTNSNASANNNGAATSGSAFDVLSKTAGFIITALMISLGAPFWFGILSSVMNLRVTGPPPASPPAVSTSPATPS